MSYMKKYFFSFVAFVAIAFTMVSCSTNSPKSVADKFLTDFYHMDFDAAKKVSTDDTKKMLDMFQQLESMMPDSTKQQLKKIKVDVKGVKEDGDKAIATYVTSDNPKEQTLHLVKQNGKWMAQWSKQDQMNDAGAADQQPMGADSTGSAPVDTAAPATQAAPDSTSSK